MAVARPCKGESAATMAIFNCGRREGRETSYHYWACHYACNQPCALGTQSRDTYGASVGVSGLEGGSGISIRVGVAIAERRIGHAEGVVLVSWSQ